MKVTACWEERHLCKMALLTAASTTYPLYERMQLFLLFILHVCFPVAPLDIQLQERRSVSVGCERSVLVSTKFQASTYRYLIVQAVTQETDLSVSFKSRWTFNSHINGSARGLLYILKGGERRIDTYLTSKCAVNHTVTSQVIYVAYSRTDPVPGGCCITCNFDNDPNIYLEKKLLSVKLRFQRANVYYDPGTKPKSCDGGSLSTFNNLEYELYAYQLTENDFSQNDLFNGMWKMSYPRNIKRYGKLIAKIAGGKSPYFLLQMIPHQGIVYNILVRDIVENSEAAYVPEFAYDCDITNIASCKSFGSVASIVYAVIGGVIGLWMCFIGHKYFKIELFIGGVITGFFIAYIMILRFSELTYTAHMISATAAGIAFGLLIIFLYLETTQFHIFLLNNAVLIGAMVACCILFSPISQLKVFSSNTVYLPAFCAMTFVVPIPLLFCPKLTSILFSSLIGGYMVVLSCSIFIHANIQYLVTEFILRAGIPSFADAYLRVPFGTNEFILCGVWGMLLFAGAFSQYFYTRGEVFPPASKRGKKRSKSRAFRWFRRRQGITILLSSERTPLLQSDNGNYHYGGTTNPDSPHDFQSRNLTCGRVV